MRVLVACEYSGIVRDAFIARGHDAMSCDLLPTDAPGPHYEGDVTEILRDGWDLLIGHRPCTVLSSCGNRWLFEDCATGTAHERTLRREAAIEFFQLLYNAPIPHVAIENPRPHPYVLERVGPISDYVQPWMFGDQESKGIYLWLRNLPPLMSTSIESHRPQKKWLLPPSADRAKLRSEFFPGVAAAMADQWGDL